MHDQVTFKRTSAAIDAGIRDGLHHGAQLYVSRNGEVLIDAAYGEARPGVRMDTDTLTLWLSAGKPLTAVAIALLVEQERLSWNTPVTEVIPSFGTGGKDEITVAHVLTHTAGLHVADEIEPLPWEEKLARICEIALPSDWAPGQRAAYSTGAGWYVLGEVVRIVTGQPVDAFVSQAVYQPFGMAETRLCFSANELPALRDRAALMFDTTAMPKPNGSWNSDAGLQRCSPGGSARGPARELGRFYERLLAGGAPVLKPATVQVITSRQRSGLLDEMFQYKMDWGYGFIINSNQNGMQMPYGYGRQASEATFGHSGNQSSCGFADPARGLSVAWVTNGMPGERKHQQRQRAINNAIYEDLCGT
jgi:CubicO group peptidase (beta-lactamase class C family)